MSSWHSTASAMSVATTAVCERLGDIAGLTATCDEAGGAPTGRSSLTPGHHPARRERRRGLRGGSGRLRDRGLPPRPPVCRRPGPGGSRPTGGGSCLKPGAASATWVGPASPTWVTRPSIRPSPPRHPGSTCSPSLSGRPPRCGRAAPTPIEGATLLYRAQLQRGRNGLPEGIADATSYLLGRRSVTVLL